MFWFEEMVDEDIRDAVIECLKKNNPSYKGHNAVCYGAGDHTLEFKKNKFATYTFTADSVVTETKGEPVVDTPVVEEPEKDEAPVVEETNKPNGNNKPNKPNGNNKPNKTNGNNKNKNKNK